MHNSRIIIKAGTDILLIIEPLFDLSEFNFYYL